MLLAQKSPLVPGQAPLQPVLALLRQLPVLLQGLLPQRLRPQALLAQLALPPRLLLRPAQVRRLLPRPALLAQPAQQVQQVPLVLQQQLPPMLLALPLRSVLLPIPLALLRLPERPALPLLALLR